MATTQKITPKTLRQHVDKQLPLVISISPERVSFLRGLRELLGPCVSFHRSVDFARNEEVISWSFDPSDSEGFKVERNEGSCWAVSNRDLCMLMRKDYNIAKHEGSVRFSLTPVFKSGESSAGVFTGLYLLKKS